MFILPHLLVSSKFVGYTHAHTYKFSQSGFKLCYTPERFEWIESLHLLYDSVAKMKTHCELIFWHLSSLF